MEEGVGTSLAETSLELGRDGAAAVGEAVELVERDAVEGVGDWGIDPVTILVFDIDEI